MSRKQWVFIGIIPAIAVAGTVLCQIKQSDPTLVRSSWRMTEMEGQPITSQKQPSLSFDGGGKISGWGACNQFTGQMYGYGSVPFVGIHVRIESWTKMNCLGNGEMRFDQRYSDMLGSVHRFEIERDGALTAYDVRGKAIARFALIAGN